MQKCISMHHCYSSQHQERCPQALAAEQLARPWVEMDQQATSGACLSLSLFEAPAVHMAPMTWREPAGWLSQHPTDGMLSTCCRPMKIRAPFRVMRIGSLNFKTCGILNFCRPHCHLHQRIPESCRLAFVPLHRIGTFAHSISPCVF